MKAWMIYVLLAVAVLFGAGSYIHYSAVADEKDKQHTQQLEDYRELKGRFDSISQQYQTLKAKRETQREVVITRENRIIDAKPTYYAGDCFDADSLQHIRDSQIPK